MRILYVCFGPQSGVINSLSKELRERHHDVTIADVSAHFKPPRLSGSTLRMIGAALWNFRRRWLQDYFHTLTAFDAMSRQAQRLIAAVKPDIVLQSGCLFGLSAPSVPYVLYEDHTRKISEAYAPWPGLPTPTPLSPAWMARERSVYHHADRILVMSDFARSSLINDYGVNESKIKVVGAGPVLPVILDLHERGDNGLTVLFVGRNLQRKGGYVLLKAMDRVRQVLPHAHLLVVGVNGPSDKHVTYTGWVPSAEIATFYRRATVFVLPSFREPFGLVFLEAMAHGLPCVGTNIEAIPEIIADGETGFIVPPGDDEMLAERLILLLKNPELRRRMGSAGRARQERQFTWQNVAVAVEDSLRSNTLSMEPRS
jgi:alpha-maltose-1-phosphate synthase